MTLSKVCFGAAVAFLATAAQAQSVVRGTVTSGADASPVPAASIVTLDGRTVARTDERGAFQIALAAGDSVRVMAPGFRAQRLAVHEGTMRVALVPFSTVLPAVVTTAGQREIRTSDTPASVTVVSRAAIDGAAAVSADQILRQLPGLQEIPREPSATTIAIRGLDGAHVLVLVDGEPVSGSMLDNRDIGRLSTIAAERIEVTKGPSSVEFGSDALGGVINLVTAAPAKQLTLESSSRVGELGRRESSLELSNTMGAFGFRVNGGWRQSDRVTGFDASSSTLDRVYDLRSDFRYRVNSRLSFRADIQGMQQRQRWPEGGGYNGFIDDHSIQGFAEGQLDALGGSFRLRAFAQRYWYEFRQAQGLLPIAGSADSLEQRERTDRVLLAYSRAAGAHVIDAGAQFTERWMRAPAKIAGDSANDSQTEFFARDNWTIGNVQLTGGARSTSSSLWGSTVSPSLGISWQAAPEWRFTANVARGFRAPSIKEIRYTFLNPGAGYMIAGNADLVPESSVNTSFGASWAPAPRLLFDIEVYRNDVGNLIDTRFTGTNGAGLQVYQNVNVASARIQGGEMSVRTSLGAYDLTLGYDYLDAKDESTKQTLDGRSTHTARANVVRHWQWLNGVVTDATARYTSAAPVGTETMGAFLSVDAQLRLNVTRMAELSVGGNNLLNQLPSFWTPAFQRQFFVGLRVRWSAD